MNAKSCAIIRAAREAQGLTQAGVAKLIHVDSDRYSAWERGTRDIPVDLLGDIARVLGVPVALIVHANVNPACIYASITNNPSVWTSLQLFYTAEHELVTTLEREITSQNHICRMRMTNCAAKSRPRRRKTGENENG